MFNIRNATTEDIPLIRELTFRVWPQTYAKLLSQEQIDYMLEYMYSVSSLEKQINDGCQFIIVYDDGNPCGFASYQELSPGKWKLHKIYVLMNQQGKGTGRFVLDHIFSVIQQKQAKTLELQVNIHNTAKSFYEKLGFTVDSTLKLDIGNGYFMNDYIMVKKFQSSELSF